MINTLDGDKRMDGEGKKEERTAVLLTFYLIALFFNWN